MQPVDLCSVLHGQQPVPPRLDSGQVRWRGVWRSALSGATRPRPTRRGTGRWSARVPGRSSL